MKKTRLIVILCLMPFILYYIFLKIQEYGDQLEAECPGWYEKRNLFPKEYKGILIKKNERNGEGMEKPISMSIDLNNQGEILHILVQRYIDSGAVLDRRFWDYVEVGDSLIKAKGSYQVKVIRGGTTKVFDIDCEAYKKELEITKAYRKRYGQDK